MHEIVVSDFHLGEGEYYKDGRLNPLEDFHHDEDFYAWLMIQHEKYGTEKICLNLLGDTFDPSQVRFLGKFIDPPYESAALYKIRGIVRGHPVLFDALRRWVMLGHSIDFFIGNHDATLSWERIQDFLRQRIAPEKPEAINFRFEKTVAQTYFAHGNWNPFSQLDREHLFIRKGQNKRGRGVILNPPDDSFFNVGVVNFLKLKNPFVGRMDRDRNGIIYIGAIFLSWRFAYLASTLWLKTLFVAVFQFLIDPSFNRLDRIKKAAKLVLHTVFHTFWNAIFGDDLEGHARRKLRAENLKAVIFGHTHGYLLKAIGSGHYANTGTWKMRFVVRPKRGLRRLLFFINPTIERQDKLTYVVVKHENNETIFVKLKEYLPVPARPTQT